ncbi:MAG TPA: SDR family NAD(P)-dependent oxidoreductase [Chitinophagaceae bacterium]|nr:SDR family NAD(P)-dependent oxidoreductase [Chitinophagaceae bacterium]
MEELREDNSSTSSPALRNGTILVTGGTGFLGAYIIKQLLQRGYAVKAIRRSPKLPAFISPEILNKVTWLDGDILDVVSLEDAMEGVDAVVHAAAIVSFNKKEKDQMYKVNVEGTANVINIALEKNIRRFVYISSVAALGRKIDGGHVDEEKKWEDNRINTNYAKSKYKAELEVWRGISEGLNTVILNPSTILGYGDWNNGSSAIFKKVFEEFKWYTPGLNGFVDVEDVAAATVLLMESSISEERFIINGDNWPFRKLMDTMADSFGKKKPVRQTTPLLLDIAWRLEKLRTLFTGRKPVLTKESAKVAHSKTYFDNAKFLKAFPGFSFTPLEKTIGEACKKYSLAHK